MCWCILSVSVSPLLLGWIPWKQLPKQGFRLAYRCKERIQNGRESMAWQQEQEASWRSMREMDSEKERRGWGGSKTGNSEKLQTFKTRPQSHKAPLPIYGPEPPQTGPPVGNQAFKYMSLCGRALLIQTITLCVLRECERWERECGHLKGNHPQSEWHY